MGPLEVIPGSHRASSGDAWDAARVSNKVQLSDLESGAGGRTAAAGDPALAVPLIVGPGDVTLYWATLQHRGSAHTAQGERPTFHIGLIGDGAPPTGVPFTLLVEDVKAMYGASQHGRTAQ